VARNTGSRPVVGTATFNVTPEQAGGYFTKVACFCFTEQVLAPGERIDMPVSFYIDPDVVNEKSMDGVTSITLSYTFFPAEDQSAARSRDQARAVTGQRDAGQRDEVSLDRRVN
jgi:cytochrome c oxidase assembly protein subunit 11